MPRFEYALWTQSPSVLGAGEIRFLKLLTLKSFMPSSGDLVAAASAIFNAGQIITSAQVVAIFESVHDESTRTLLARLFETLQFQNEALESLRLAVEKLDSEGGGK
jgi:hypothetical protein